MRLSRMLLASFLLVVMSIPATAGDFGWVDDFNVQAKGDPAGFRSRIKTRFHVGDAEIDAVMVKVRHPADAYIVFRFGEISNRPWDHVLGLYRNGRGWGSLAKSLGIKPGSSAFHHLKNGHDLYDPGAGISVSVRIGHASKGKGNGKSNGKGKGKK